MSLHKGIRFENDICAHLAAHGWLYGEGDAQGYDSVRALFPHDVPVADAISKSSSCPCFFKWLRTWSVCMSIPLTCG
jgi:type I restriction enzyme R subunit